ncbi:MAG TPA: cytochrome C [Gammaproteobacteria bacterium]|nr:cytochrome C [Gammaproteobacteria bacterium]
MNARRLFLIAALVLPLVARADVDGMALLQSQCSSCHDLKGPAPTTLQALWARKGPDLFYAGNKYKRDWLERWLQKPYRIRPAGMYYGNHIKEGEDGDVIDESTLKPHVKLGAEEARAVADALMTLKAGSDLIKKGEYKPGRISLSMGELMFDKFRGCLACHEIEPGYGGLSGPEVYTVGRRLQEDYLISYMRNPQAWDPRIFMPNKHLKERDLQKFVHYFRALSEEEFEDEE